jgi:probable rRNA maturation factor
VAVPCAVWRTSVPQAVAVARRAVRAALALAAPDIAAAEISVVLADDATVARLNREFRDKPGPTNVLSFPCEDEAALDGPALLGDVVLACETVMREACERALAPADHLAHLVVHGVLHLLGHDHETDGEARRMEALEVAALARMGIGDPYQRAQNAA